MTTLGMFPLTLAPAFDYYYSFDSDHPSLHATVLFSLVWTNHSPYFYPMIMSTRLCSQINVDKWSEAISSKIEIE